MEQCAVEQHRTELATALVMVCLLHETLLVSARVPRLDC